MGKDKFKKIPISEFISDKKLSKIKSIIEKSDDVETNYDRIEMLLDDDYDVKDLGTNRLVLIHKKNKYKNLIFKVAGDSHGIEANYREFYNGDLDKRLTFSYSISKDGTFIVQERVKPMTRDLMKKHKKEVREMLTKLSKKLLLVDCKIENFKNFGIRENGDMCLLDHGDTVPLPNYQGNDIVNVNEESFVSLKCKKPEEMSTSKKNLKPCGGKLKYSKNFDYLICEKCSGICTVNDAYREFYGDKSVKIKGSIGLDLDDSFDPDEWKAHIQKYCIETMSHADNNLNNEGEENAMKTKTIENKNCVQVKGFWLPEPTGEFAEYGAMYTAVKMGTTKPQKYLEKLGLNIDDYKVYPSEHTPSEKNKKRDNVDCRTKINVEHNIDEYGFDLLAVRDKIVEKIISIGKYQTQISYFECVKLAPEVDFSNIRNIQIIREAISSDKRTAGCIYNEEGFSVRLNNKYITSQDDNKVDATKITIDKVTEIFEEETTVLDNNQDIKPMTSGYVHVVNVDDEEDIEDCDFITTSSSDNVDYIDSDDFAREYAACKNTTVVEDCDKYEDTRPKLVFSYDDLEENTIDYNGVKCVVINKYAVPVDIIYRYSNEEGFYELPSTKMKSLLKANGLHPKKYKVTNSESVEETDSESIIDSCTSKSEISNISESNETVSAVYSPGEYTSDNITFISEFEEFASIYAKEHIDNIDKFGTIEIPASEIIVNCLLNHVDNGEIVPIVSNVCDIEYDEEGNISVSISYDNLSTLYKMICIAKGSGVDISCNYMNMCIGVILETYKPKCETDEQKYSEFIESTIKRCTVDNVLDLTTESIPIIHLNPLTYFNEDTSDPISNKHEAFNVAIETLDEVFSKFYSEFDDTFLTPHNNPEPTEIELMTMDIVNAYKSLKKDIFTSCKELDAFYDFLRKPRTFSTISTVALLMADVLEKYSDDDDNMGLCEDVSNRLDVFMNYINPDSTSMNISHDLDCNEEYSDVNSYSTDNNTNNNEEIATYSEDNIDDEEDEILNQQILNAILELTKAVNSNNEIMSKQNELMSLKFNSLDEKIDAVTEIVSPKYIPEVMQESVVCETNISEKVHNSNDDIVMLSETDLDKKIIAVNINNTTVCFDILDLAKKATSNTDAEYLSVTDITVSNL